MNLLNNLLNILLRRVRILCRKNLENNDKI